ncbi:unnamed protein product [Amoebophrya sp. A25]|nr:unnamed protein product [Amoebophrya sp. A25]|eukprot:GSA25T00009316001.1
MSGVETMLAGGLGLKAVAMMRQASLTMKRAARQAFAMAADANIAAIQARTAESELERYVQGSPVVQVGNGGNSFKLDGSVQRISSFCNVGEQNLAGGVSMLKMMQEEQDRLRLLGWNTTSRTHVGKSSSQPSSSRKPRRSNDRSQHRKQNLSRTEKSRREQPEALAQNFL